MAPSRPRHSHSPQISWRTGARPQRRHARRGGALQPREAAAARRRRASGTPLPLPPPRARQSWTSLPHTWHSGRCSRPRRTRVAPPQQAKLYSPVTVLLRCRANRKEQIRPDGRAAGRRTLQGLALGPVVVLISVEAAMAAPGEISALQLLPGSAETAEIDQAICTFWFSSVRAGRRAERARYPIGSSA